MTGGQQTGEECVESEEHCGREQTARGRADERDAHGDIEHIESTTVNGQAIIKIFLQPTETLARGHILAGKAIPISVIAADLGIFSCQHP